MTSQKRHAALIPLSHDHHYGLMAAVRLKRGETAYPESTDIGDSIKRLWKEELEEHFAQEEKHLFPLPDYPESIHAMIDRALDDHRQMRELVDECHRGEALEEAARKLGVLLESHIRFEERELFPAMQEWLSEEMIAKLGQEITGRRGQRES